MQRHLLHVSEPGAAGCQAVLGAGGCAAFCRSATPGRDGFRPSGAPPFLGESGCGPTPPPCGRSAGAPGTFVHEVIGAIGRLAPKRLEPVWQVLQRQRSREVRAHIRPHRRADWADSTIRSFGLRARLPAEWTGVSRRWRLFEPAGESCPNSLIPIEFRFCPPQARQGRPK